MPTTNPPDTGCTTLPARPPGPTRSWAAPVIVIVAVLGSAAGLLLAGHPLRDAILGACGAALLSGQVARRIVVDAGPTPLLVAACAVAGFGATLHLNGHTMIETAAGTSLAALGAGEIAARVLGTPRPRWGV